nr:hypothetical protein [Tanacetum cinerariifolium]
MFATNPLIDHHCCYECGNSLNDFFCPDCTCEFCGNGAHVGYNCPAQVPTFQTLPSFPQQYPCCEDYGVTHKPYQCQPKNHDYYDEQNSCYDSNSFGFDQIQTPQYTVNHPIFNTHNKLMEQMTSMCEMLDQLIQKKQEEKQIQEDQAANTRYCKIPAYYDDDDDEEEYNSLKDNNISELPPCSAITPNETADSLNMGDKHLDTVPATESDEQMGAISFEIHYACPSNVEDGDNMKYAPCTMLDGALTWWNLYVQTVEMVTPEAWMIEYYVGGLSQKIKGNVTSSKPTDIHETITMAQSLMD